MIVIGGAGAEFTHRALSRVVEAMLDGVPVIAMQGGMTWATADGLRIDTGAYLPGLEAAGRSRIADAPETPNHALDSVAELPALLRGVLEVKTRE
ncbi:hypothetical protein [Nocardia wallacei]|uniref:hypothetical protein n=1 Tax=Nocardia wallacei TaxID=480035 RepID=UPI002453832B|nr:hypothetical protein [Nocardia wallacei]